MGRYFKTAKPTFVDDVIYQAPHELMAKALQVQDQNFEDTIKPLEGTEALYDNLQFIDKDAPLRKKKILDLNNTIQTLTEKAHKNPALAKGLKGEINKARKNLEQEVKVGDLFNMDRNAKTRDKVRKDLKTKLDKGTISSDAYEAALETLDREYGGVEKGFYEDNIHVYDKIDEEQFQKNLKMTINLDSTSKSNTRPTGAGYMIENGETKTYLTKERLNEIIDSDPTVDKWKREQLQTLERQLNNGLYESEAEMQKEYKNRLDKFKENTIAKLNFTKINSENKMSTDSAYHQNANRAQAAKHFKQTRKDVNGEYFTTEINGTFEDLDDSTVEELAGEMEEIVTIPSFSVLDNKNKSFKASLTTAQKRKFLDEEKASLQKQLKAERLTFEDMREKMKTFEGRTELQRLGFEDLDMLSRQANYNKNFTYKSVTVPGYDSDNPPGLKTYQNFVKAKIKNLQQIDPTQKLKFRYVDAKGKSHVKEMSQSEAYTKGFSGIRLLEGEQIKVDAKDYVKNAGGYYTDNDGRNHIYPEDYYDETKRGKAIPLQEIIKSGKDIKSVKVKKNVFDKSKSLLSVKPDELFEFQDVKYNGGYKVKKTDYTVVQKKAVDKEGNPIVIFVEVDNKYMGQIKNKTNK